ncbi:MAG: hypothetical protein DHS20C15_25560 [Planctomycetota bacterium]|nr:MAG: hypothetical protein DHS20C15_25560 [Planctomycetota bacterium]
MSYFSYPRIHFSGHFKASPSTINNAPDNFDPACYPSPNELQKVELYWNPRGDGGFNLVDCKVTRVDYADGSVATTPEQDPIVGQPVVSVRNPGFPIDAAIVDLDPMQQNVSEIWGLVIQIGDASVNLTGNFSAIAFTSIWVQAQGPNAPHSSASGSGIYQSTLKNLQVTGDPGASKFLQHFAGQPSAECSFNFNLNSHNNSPPIYQFNAKTFDAMRALDPPVPEAVLQKLMPMQELVQNLPPHGQPRGDVPTQDFVLFMLGEYLTTDEYNNQAERILNATSTTYHGSGPQDFLFGLVSGTAAPTVAGEPTNFVANRMLNPTENSPAFDAPFVVAGNGTSLVLNLGNSLPTENPGFVAWNAKLGTLTLVALTDGLNPDGATSITTIPYDDPAFLTEAAGFFSFTLPRDCSTTPLGLVSEVSGTRTLILAENLEGYYLRADQFVFRMNPGLPTTAEFPRGETATATVHALRFGEPVPDGTPITVTMMTPKQAFDYTNNTVGTGGTIGLKNLSVPPEAVQVNGTTIHADALSVTATTVGGVATFNLSCTDPGNPRHYISGQIYFLNYMFADATIAKGYHQNSDDLLSLQVYSQDWEPDAPTTLAKWGRIYKVMNMLTDEKAVSSLNLRNLIKTMLERPYSAREHMPLTRDLGAAAHNKIISWINHLNNG